MSVLPGAHFYDLFEHLRVWPWRGYSLPALGCICEDQRAWVRAGRSLRYYWQWVPAGCDLRGCRQTFEIDDNMSPRRMSRQRKKQHAQQPRQEQKVTRTISPFQRWGLLYPDVSFHASECSKQGKTESGEWGEGGPSLGVATMVRQSPSLRLDLLTYRTRVVTVSPLCGGCSDQVRWNPESKHGTGHAGGARWHGLEFRSRQQRIQLLVACHMLATFTLLFPRGPVSQQALGWSMLIVIESKVWSCCVKNNWYAETLKQALGIKHLVWKAAL